MQDLAGTDEVLAESLVNMIEAAEQALETLAQRNARVAQAHAPQGPETSTATQRDDASTLETPDLPVEEHTTLSHG
jgi:hypothetical protein